MFFFVCFVVAKRETDDGSYKYYLRRVDEWKNKETRLTGKMHTFDDGFKMPSYLWDSLYKCVILKLKIAEYYYNLHKLLW